MATDISNIRTMQDVINVLSVVYFNMNEIERIYYDMFINPMPMDVTFQRYNDEGVLETITLPNRAKASFNVLTGEGSPNNVVAANIGVFYLDLNSGDMYYKGQDAGSASGWFLMWNSTNLQRNVDFLPPDGDASFLQNLNMDKATSGTLKVSRGGTFVNSITGLVKGNGDNPFSAAVDGVDYLGPGSMTGLIAYYPNATIPVGWLKCDGRECSRSTYARLFNIIGTTYGAGDGSTTFNIPDLRNYFVRCWDDVRPFNTAQEAQVGGHTHALVGSTTVSENDNHTHTCGTMQITGRAIYRCQTAVGTRNGAFSSSTTYKATGHGDTMRGNSVIDLRLIANASNGWTGHTSAATSNHTHELTGDTANNNEGAENTVLNKMLVPIIKY